MRVRILTQHYAPEVTAGRYRVEAFAQRFAAHGHRVEVVCPVPNHPQGRVHPGYRGRPVRSAELDGVKVLYLRTWTTPRRSLSARLGYYGTYAAAAVASAAVLGRPDVILASSPPLTVAAAAATSATLRRVPWIFDVRDLWPQAAVLIGELTNPRAVRAAERLERRLYESADRVVAVTRPFVEKIRGGLARPDKVELIPNGTTRMWLEADKCEPDRKALGLDPGRFIWTYAGNLGPSRPLDLAIDAARRLGNPFQLLVIGEGATRGRLEELARELPDGTVEFRDAMPADRAAEHARASDALLVPQQPGLGDFVPSKLYDFSAVGRPVVVAADGETARLTVESELGLCVQPEDADAVADAVRRLRDEPDLSRRLAAHGRLFARDHLREDQGDQMVKIAESLA